MRPFLLLLLAAAALVAAEPAPVVEMEVDAALASEDPAVEPEPLAAAEEAGEQAEEAEEAATLAVIDEELAAVEELIRLQQRKASRLETLRREFLAGKRGGVKVRHVAELLNAPAPGPAQAQAQAAAPAPERGSPESFSDYLIERALVTVEDDDVVTALDLLQVKQRGLGRSAKKHNADPPQFVAVGTQSGRVLFYESDGALMHSLEAGARPVTGISFDSEEALAYVARDDGSLGVYNLTLWLEDSVVAGKRPKSTRIEAEDGGEPTIIKATPPPSLTHSGYALVVQHERELLAPGGQRLVEPETPALAAEGAVGRVTALVSYHWKSKHRMVIAGDADGSLWFLMRNGTLQGARHTDFPITAMRRAGPTLAYTAGTDVALFSLPRMTPLGFACSGTTSPISNLGYDVLHSGHLYAGTASGDVLVFNTKHRVDSKQSCKLLSRFHSRSQLPPDGRPRDAFVAAVRGYALVSVPDALSVYNVSDGGAFEFDRALEPALDAEGAPVTPLISVTRPGSMMLQQPNILVAFSAVGSSQITVLESLLPYTPPDHDISWLRSPLLIGGLIAVFGYQFMRYRKNAAAGPDFGGGMPAGMPGGMAGMGGMGRGGGGGEDMAELMRSFDQHDRARGGQGLGEAGGRFGGGMGAGAMGGRGRF